MTVRGVANTACAAAIVLGQAVSLAILLATLLWEGWGATLGLGLPSLMDALILLPFVGTIVAGRRLWQTLRAQSARPWAHAWFLGFAFAAMLASFAWFRDPMHDIALQLGSHGRWGCQVVRDDGSPAFLVRDSTLPLMLFLPILVVTAAGWLARSRVSR